MSTDLNYLESEVKELKDKFFKASVLTSAVGILVLGWLATTNFYSIPKAIVDLMERGIIKSFEEQARIAAEHVQESEKRVATTEGEIAKLHAKLQKDVGSHNFKVVMAGSQEVSTNGGRFGFSDWFDLPKSDGKQIVIASPSIVKNQDWHFSSFVEIEGAKFRFKIHDIDGHPHPATVRVDYLVVEPTSLSSTSQSVAVSK